MRKALIQPFEMGEIVSEFMSAFGAGKQEKSSLMPRLLNECPDRFLFVEQPSIAIAVFLI